MALTAINTRIDDPQLLRALRRIEQDLLDRTALAQFQYVDVVFNGVANADTIIVHKLQTNDPEGIDYQIVGLRLAADPSTVPIIYADKSADRKAWGDGYIVLRSNVASLDATLLLSLRTT